MWANCSLKVHGGGLLYLQCFGITTSANITLLPCTAKHQVEQCCGALSAWHVAVASCHRQALFVPCHTLAVTTAGVELKKKKKVLKFQPNMCVISDRKWMEEKKEKGLRIRMELCGMTWIWKYLFSSTFLLEPDKHTFPHKTVTGIRRFYPSSHEVASIKALP